MDQEAFEPDWVLQDGVMRELEVRGTRPEALALSRV